MNNKRGITLIALVVTIVVVVILTAIIINSSIGGNGLFKRTNVAAEKYKNEQVKEQDGIESLDNAITIASDRQFPGTMAELKALMLDTAYPVGSIYITTSDKNPSETIGGEWEKYSQGRTLIGDGTDEEGDTNGEKVSFTAGNKGGEYKHTMTVAEMPSHNHGLTALTGYDDLNFINGSGIFMLQNSDTTLGWGGAKNAGYKYGNTGDKGSSEAHNNTQPYIVTYIWKRIK